MDKQPSFNYKYLSWFFAGAVFVFVLMVILANILPEPTSVTGTPPITLATPGPSPISVPGPSPISVPGPGPSGSSPSDSFASFSPVPAPAPSPDLFASFSPAPGPSFTPASASPAPAPFLPSINPKKGFVYDLKINGVTNSQFNTQMQSLNLGWYYTWGLTGSPGLSLPFTPMVWGAPDAQKLSQIPSGSTELLAFNEPDGNNQGAQSNMSISQVVALWSQLKATGLRIGSIAAYTSPLATSYTTPPGPPAAGRLPPAQTSLTTSYFDALWSALVQAGNTPDFIALHWYAPPDADGFLEWIDAIYTKYQKPIWITEMCPADWTATTSNPEKFSTSQIQTFMDAVVAGMNSRSYVERFCWKTRPTTDVNMGNGALIALDGTLTPLGQHYATL